MSNPNWPASASTVKIATTSADERALGRTDRSERPPDTHLVKVLGVRALLPVRGTRDQKVAMIAAVQRGRVARRQLLAVGVTPAMIGLMLRKWRLHRLHAGVYAVGHLAPVELGRETAALLSFKSEAVLSHGTAAAMWKLRPATPGPIELTVVGAGTGRRAGIRVHRTRRLDDGDVRIVHGLPVTSPARTLFDLAEQATGRELERALDEAIVQRLAQPRELAEAVKRMHGRRGASRIAVLLENYRTKTVSDSEAEEAYLGIIRAAGLPQPQMNACIHGCRPDFYWPEYGLVVEVDGYKYHSTRSKFERDRAKGAKLAAAGLNVMRVTWLQMERAPFAVAVQTAQAIAWAEARRAG